MSNIVMKQNSFYGMITLETSSTLSQGRFIMKQTMNTIVKLVVFLWIGSVQMFAVG
jgi:hypothetical protein